MADLENEKSLEENLWVLVKLKESLYAVDGAHVESILLMEADVTRMPSNDDVNIGVIPFRDCYVPIIDLRRYLGMRSFYQEAEEFEHMLETRKQDHVNWMKELERCVKEKEAFTLSRDAHQCAFGKWYDNYTPTSHTIDLHLRKIDDPHKKLHHLAVEIFGRQENCVGDCNECVWSEERCAQLLKEGNDIYVATVLNLLDEAKKIFQDSYRKIVVILSKNGIPSCGILVDEVLSAEYLDSLVENNTLWSEGRSAAVTYIAQRKNDTRQVLVLSVEKLINTYDEGAVS